MIEPMLRLIAEALWLFLPALAANQMPGLVAHLNVPGNFPVSKRWLGANNTWAAYYAGPIGAVLALLVQRQFESINAAIGLFEYGRPRAWLIALALGLGAILGDHAKSFLKRRIGIPPGERWWPFDQLDFVAGSLTTVTPLIGRLGWGRIAVIAAAVLAIHPLGNRASHGLGLRKTPW